MKTKSMILGALTSLMLIACASSPEPLDPKTPKIVNAYGDGWQVVLTSKQDATLTLRTFGAFKPTVTSFNVTPKGADVSMDLANGMYQYHLVINAKECMDTSKQKQPFTAKLIRAGHENKPRIGCAILNPEGK